MSHQPQTASIVLADDSESYRAGLVRAFEREPRLNLVAAVEDGDAALASIRTHRPDVALLDVNMPGRTGLEVCAALEDPWPTRVVLISAAMEPGLLAAARHAGAVTGLGKELTRQRIIEALLAAVPRPAYA